MTYEGCQRSSISKQAEEKMSTDMMKQHNYILEFRLRSICLFVCLFIVVLPMFNFSLFDLIVPSICGVRVSSVHSIIQFSLAN